VELESKNEAVRECEMERLPRYQYGRIHIICCRIIGANKMAKIHKPQNR